MRQSFSIKRLKMKAHHKLGVTSDGYDFGAHGKNFVVALFNYLLIYLQLNSGPTWLDLIGYAMRLGKLRSG